MKRACALRVDTTIWLMRKAATNGQPNVLSKYVDLGSPYWWPHTKGRYPNGAKSALGMLCLFAVMIVFCFAGLYIASVLTATVLSAVAPAWIEQTFPNLQTIVLAPLTKASHTLVIFVAFCGPICWVWKRHSRLGGEPALRQWILLTSVLLLSTAVLRMPSAVPCSCIAVTGLNVVLSYVGNFFTTALNEREEENFYGYMIAYFSVFVVAIPIIPAFRYVQGHLAAHWRESMTGSFLRSYFSNRAYYQLSLWEHFSTVPNATEDSDHCDGSARQTSEVLNDKKVDNPDQRLAEDIKSFTSTSLSFILILLSAVMDLCAFIGILQSVSSKLVWILIVYAVVGNSIAAYCGRRLVSLNYQLLAREADLRFTLVHVRNQVESIAFYGGENVEQSIVRSTLRTAITVFLSKIRWQLYLGFFTTGFEYVPLVLPYLVLAPEYFAGRVQFGDLTQAHFAFRQVLGSLSIIVSEIESLSSFSASIDRLWGFKNALEESCEKIPSGTTTWESEISNLDVQILSTKNLVIQMNAVSVVTPHPPKRSLVSNVDLSLNTGDSVLIVGPSGTGKSSLLRAIAGLWSTGSGTIYRPSTSDTLFLPQRPYMGFGSLRQQLLYPDHDEALYSESSLLEVLEKVNLGGLVQRLQDGLETVAKWEAVLSIGEQQRIAFCRLLLRRPRLAVLDEATSALDAATERLLYERVKRLGITYISVGHRRSLINYHNKIVAIGVEPDPIHMSAPFDEDALNMVIYGAS